MATTLPVARCVNFGTLRSYISTRVIVCVRGVLSAKVLHICIFDSRDLVMGHLKMLLQVGNAWCTTIWQFFVLLSKNNWTELVSQKLTKRKSAPSASPSVMLFIWQPYLRRNSTKKSTSTTTIYTCNLFVLYYKKNMWPVAGADTFSTGPTDAFFLFEQTE